MKPKEFVLNSTQSCEIRPGETLHVIEYSAYKSEKDRADKAEALLRDINDGKYKYYLSTGPNGEEVPDYWTVIEAFFKDTPTESSSPITALVHALETDPGYRVSWVANIAMAFKDEWQRAVDDGGLPATPDQIHVIANKAAEYFLWLLCEKRPTIERKK